MPWNWQLPEWPQFKCDFNQIAKQERQFLLEIGKASAFLKTLSDEENSQFIIEILSSEGLESSKIEGEILDRESLQSSIKKHFGLNAPPIKKNGNETGMAKLLASVYKSFNAKLTHEMLFHWHACLFDTQSKISDIGKYRTHSEPMQIISNRFGNEKVFFEAPPSSSLKKEMDAYINWFNNKDAHETVLGRAAIAHLYFESIHPFEDGNGRIGRLLVEKMLSQALQHPILIAVSKILEKRKKHYYQQLENCNKTLDAGKWIIFFANTVLEAQEDSMRLLYFLIEKSKMMTRLSEHMNERQTKVILRMFAEGPSGFKGGLSAKKYIAITKTSRATATRDLVDLTEKKALIKTGELRHTRYSLNLPPISGSTSQ